MCGQAWRRTKILSQNKYLAKCEYGKKMSSDLFLKFWLYSQNWILIFFSTLNSEIKDSFFPPVSLFSQIDFKILRLKSIFWLLSPEFWD